MEKQIRIQISRTKINEFLLNFKFFEKKSCKYMHEYKILINEDYKFNFPKVNEDHLFIFNINENLMLEFIIVQLRLKRYVKINKIQSESYLFFENIIKNYYKIENKIDPLKLIKFTKKNIDY